MNDILTKLFRNIKYSDPKSQQRYGDLSLYGCQYNIAIKIIDKWINKRSINIDDNKITNKINILIISPASISVMKQTKRDYNMWRNNNLNKCICYCKITNSSSILKKGDKFLNKLRNTNDLNIIIHDEGHWGIAEESNINFFLNKVSDIIYDVSDHYLLILIVSATIDVITQTTLNNNNDHIIWKDLRTIDDIFKSDTYISTDNLVYKYDPTYKDINKSDASDLIITEYNTSLNNICNNINDQTFSYKIIKDLITNPSICILRLSSISQVKDLYDKVIKYKSKYNILNKLYVINYTDTPGTIKDQLIEQGFDTSLLLNNKTLICDLNTNFSYLILVVVKLSMGERIPNIICNLDVRAIYRGNINVKARYLQDIGRLAGHNKQVSKVYLSAENNNVKKLHNLLGNKDQPTNKHPQYTSNSKVYSKLNNFCVVLNAEPQIGKTGAIICVISIMDDLIYKLQEYKTQPYIKNIVETYKHTRLYKWLIEDLDYLNTLNNITDQWILDNYSCYNIADNICRVERIESNYYCINCKSRFIRLDTNQGRRSDESSTTIYSCISCGHVYNSINRDNII